MLVAVVVMPFALKVIGLPARPAPVASTVFSPGPTPSVQAVTRATPEVSVVVVLGAKTPPSRLVMLNITGKLGTGFPYWSATRTAGGVLTAWPAVAVCVSMLTRISCAATSRVPLAVNSTGLPDSPLAVAVSVFCPTSVPSCQVPTLATPAVSVTADPPVTLPPPEAGAKRTGTPGTGLLNWSRTIAAAAVGRIVLTIAA